MMGGEKEEGGTVRERITLGDEVNSSLLRMLLVISKRTS